MWEYSCLTLRLHVQMLLKLADGRHFMASMV